MRAEDRHFCPKNFHPPHCTTFSDARHVLNTALPSPHRIPPSRRHDSHYNDALIVVIWQPYPSIITLLCLSWRRVDGRCSFACTTFVPELPRHIYRCILRQYGLLATHRCIDRLYWSIVRCRYLTYRGGHHGGYVIIFFANLRRLRQEQYNATIINLTMKTSPQYMVLQEGNSNRGGLQPTNIAVQYAIEVLLTMVRHHVVCYCCQHYKSTHNGKNDLPCQTTKMVIMINNVTCFHASAIDNHSILANDGMSVRDHGERASSRAFYSSGCERRLNKIPVL